MLFSDKTLLLVSEGCARPLPLLEESPLTAPTPVAPARPPPSAPASAPAVARLLRLSLLRLPRGLPIRLNTELLTLTMPPPAAALPAKV